MAFSIKYADNLDPDDTNLPGDIDIPPGQDIPPGPAPDAGTDINKDTSDRLM